MIPLAFANAGMLAALLVLPVIWYFLRLTPPRPVSEAFPPTRLLLDIDPREEQPSRSPWWLTALRLAAAAAIILALAGPILSPDNETLPGNGDLLVVVDNGWDAAASWEDILDTARRTVERAGEAGRPISLLATAEPASQPVEPADAGTIMRRIEALEPRPWKPDLAVLAGKLGSAGPSAFGGAVAVMAGQAADGTDAFAAALETTVDGPIVTYLDRSAPIAALAPPVNTADALTVPVLRADGASDDAGYVRARDMSGRVIGETPFAFPAGETRTEAEFAVPTELRNEIVRLEIADTASAGAVHLIDDRWRRRRIGLVSGASAEHAQPLLSPLYYISRAVSPFADVREPGEANAAIAINQLIESGSSLIALADIGILPPDVEDQVAEWVRSGGTLVRFAGPRLAAEADSLIPVDLRSGDRVLGGSLSWQTPQALASFGDNSPFADMAVPEDVRVSRQVLAQPDGALAERTWAALADGTPLVTAAPLGRGTLILFHVTADTSWSNLPLSGTFVDMLRRIIAFSNNVGGTETGEAQPAPPFRLLDGFGRFVPPGARVQPIAARPGDIRIGPENPPGLYGSEEGFVALNLIDDDDTLARFAPSAIAADDVRPFPSQAPTNLAPWLLALVLLLLAIDTMVVLMLNGALRFRKGFGGRLRPGAAGMVVAGLLAATVAPGHGRADELTDDYALRAANTTRLAYVVTGDADVDEISRAGMAGISQILAERTSLEPGEPMGVDPARDELAFFPLIYWPVTPETPLPEAATMARIGAYMRQGGSVIFDTRDQLERTTSTGTLTGTPATARLQDMLSGLDIPPLEPVPTDHVLTKAFYLLNEFPGRYAGGPLWVEALGETTGTSQRPARAADGVSTILITSNDFAGAWAIDDTGRFMLPTVPPDRLQREMSLRTGVNIVMYTLTGNYKADQVHIPALLERLGQ